MQVAVNGINGPMGVAGVGQINLTGYWEQTWTGPRYVFGDKPLSTADTRSPLCSLPEFMRPSSCEIRISDPLKPPTVKPPPGAYSQGVLTPEQEAYVAAGGVSDAQIAVWQQQNQDQAAKQAAIEGNAPAPASQAEPGWPWWSGPVAILIGVSFLFSSIHSS